MAQIARLGLLLVGRAGLRRGGLLPRPAATRRRWWTPCARRSATPARRASSLTTCWPGANS